ncbi:carboxymuconolactone decarboxylase family protein [Leptospira ilyithenensis]
MLKNEEFAQSSGIEPKLYELIKIRVSQINGCAFCIDMHTSDTRKAGEEEKRIYLLNAWRETSFYSDKEKAALEYSLVFTHQEQLLRLFSDGMYIVFQIARGS